MAFTVHETAAHIADDLDTTTLNPAHGVPAQLRAARTAADFTDVADHLEVLRDNVGAHGADDNPVLFDHLDEAVNRIRGLAA